MGYADVALPVPLRRTFTYRVPDPLAVEPGMRVAVPFSGRKLPGIVLALRDAPPEGVTRIAEIAGLIEGAPLFPPELLHFLERAADYYLAPVGEVLRAASPALPRAALSGLKRSGFVGAEAEIKGKSLASKQTWRISVASSSEQPGRLGARQRALLALLDERGAMLLTELRVLLPGARAAAKSLADKGVVNIEEVEVQTDRFLSAQLPREPPFTPNAEQRGAIDALIEALEAHRFGAFLLHGVTGSGKTEVYLQLVARALELGGGVLVLVPEIALTPQLVARFRRRFGEAIAVLHSGLSDRARDDAWRALRRADVRLAIGARSAVFAPVPNLRVVVVDEEHDPSFKQEEGFRYNGRDMALLRAQLASALCVLGSASPAIETFFLSEHGKAQRLTLAQRAQQQALPEVEVVDLVRHPGPGPTGHPLLTGPLSRALRQCLDLGGQAILFLNRRGFSPSLSCGSCGELLRCPACSVSLTEHRRAGLLRCHYCDFAMGVTEACPACGDLALERVGVGTERVEDALREGFPGTRVGRLDRDTAAGSGVEEVLDRMRARELDVLVGTQMVTKGHDLPGVTLVGVLTADQSLLFPDFRASERTFQLLLQVAGRAGRGETPGRVVLQTYQPDHYAVARALRHDYRGFYATEIAARRELQYPPFSRLAAVRIDAGDESVARAVSAELARIAASVAGDDVRVLGPAPAPIERLRGRYRMRFLLRARSRPKLRQVAQAVLARIERGIAPARAHVDLDPVSML